MNVHSRTHRISFNNPEMMDLKQSLLSVESVRKSQIKNLKSKKIIIVGLKNTGKTTLLLKFLYDFSGFEETCSEENYTTSLT